MSELAFISRQNLTSTHSSTFCGIAILVSQTPQIFFLHITTFKASNSKYDKGTVSWLHVIFFQRHSNAMLWYQLEQWILQNDYILSKNREYFSTMSITAPLQCWILPRRSETSKTGVWSFLFTQTRIFRTGQAVFAEWASTKDFVGNSRTWLPHTCCLQDVWEQEVRLPLKVRNCKEIRHHQIDAPTSHWLLLAMIPMVQEWMRVDWIVKM